MGMRLLFCIGVASVLAGAAGAGDKAEVMRGLVAAHGETVVTVKMAVKETFSMAEYGTEVSEYTQDIQATVISPEGLMVTSLMRLDPGAMMENLFFDEGDDDLETEVTSLRVLRGQVEVESEIVLRDTDLDLAFLRPIKKPEDTWPHVDLSTSPEVQAFDPLYVLGRLGLVANRLPSVGEARLKGIIEKPRRTFIIGEYTGQGMPVYTEAGACLGINVTRVLKMASNSGMGYTSGFESNMASIVVPGPDVLELVEQVPAYKEGE